MRLRTSEDVGEPWDGIPFVLTVLAFLLASLAQVHLSQRENVAGAVVLLAAAVALVLVAFRHLPADGVKEEGQSRSSWDRRSMLVLLVASLPAWVAGWLLAVRWDSLFPGLVLYGCGLALVCGVCARRERWRLPQPSSVREHWVELTLVGLVLVLGLFLRLYRLDYYPPPGGISWNDEAQIGKDAYGILHHGYHPWQFFVSIYATCVSFLALGPTVLALRLTFVLLGALTLVVFYLLMREIFRFPVALAATFLFSVSRWHIAFSRLVLPSTPAMLLEVSSFYLLFRGRRTGGMMNYVVAGLTMSLGLHSHASFRVVPLLVLVLLASQAWTAWSAGEGPAAGRLASLVREMGSRCVAFLGSTAVFILPLAAIVRRSPHVAFGERFMAVMPMLFESGRAPPVEGLLERAQRVLGFFNYQGEGWGAVNLPDLPMLDPWTGVLFMLGLGYCLFYFWRKWNVFYLSWFLITIIGGGVLTLDLRSHRYAGVMPVLFVFAGVFVEGAYVNFRRAFGESRRVYFGLILAPILLAAAYVNYDIFFDRQVHADAVRIEFTREVAAVANYVASLGEGHYVYLFANFPYYMPGMDFAWIAGEAPGARGVDVLDVIPTHWEGGDEDLVYIFVTPYNVDALAEVVKHYYPGADLETFEGDYGRYTFVTAHVTAEEVRRSRGLTGSYYSGESFKAEADLVRQEAQIAFDWSAEDPPLAFPFSAEWKGTLYAPEAGPYVFETEPRGVARFYVDGFEVGEGEETGLVKGWHTLHMVCSGLKGVDSLRLLWTGPGREPGVVPSEFLSPKEEVNGILVSVFEGPDFRGAPVEESVQPVLSLLRMPTAWASAFVPQLAGEQYSLEGRGQFRVEEAGSHRFDVGAWNGNASLYIDGNLVVMVAQSRTLSSKSEVELTPGWHDLWLRYSYGGGEFSGVQVFWTPPGGERECIPTRLLRPVGDVMTRVGG